MYWMLQNGVIDFSLNLYRRSPLEFGNPVLVQHFWFVCFLPCPPLFLFYVTRTRKSIYKSIFISHCFVFACPRLSSRASVWMERRGLCFIFSLWLDLVWVSGSVVLWMKTFSFCVRLDSAVLSSATCVCVCVRAHAGMCAPVCWWCSCVCVCVCVLNQYSNLACCVNWMLKDFGEDFINVNYVSMYSMYVCNVCKRNQWKKMMKKKRCRVILVSTGWSSAFVSLNSFLVFNILCIQRF